MKKMLLTMFLCALIALFTKPDATLAKANTVKLVVTGGGLKHALTITDPNILALSNVWIGNFLDSRQAAIRTAPADLQTYTVAFYASFARNDTRKVYVVDYRPDPIAMRGYMYLASGGTADGDLNQRSITREGRDGMWNYATPDWDGLMQAEIESARGATSNAKSK